MQSKEPTNPPEKLLRPLPPGVVSPANLSNTFALMMQRYQLRQPQSGRLEISEASIEHQVEYLKNLFTTGNDVSFFKAVDEQPDINFVVGLFLAVLELISQGFLSVIQTAQFADLTLHKNEEV